MVIASLAFLALVSHYLWFVCSLQSKNVCVCVCVRVCVCVCVGACVFFEQLHRSFCGCSGVMLRVAPCFANVCGHGWVACPKEA